MACAISNVALYSWVEALQNAILPPPTRRYVAMKPILVPLDLSPVSRRVLQASRKLARSIRARIVLIHVVKEPLLVSDFPGMLIDMTDIMGASERAARAYLVKRRRELMKAGLAADLRLKTGIPADEIVREARALRPSYIVIGSHGHNALYNLVVGGTAGAVLKAAPCPVVVVRSAPRPKGRARRAKAK